VMKYFTITLFSVSFIIFIPLLSIVCTMIIFFDDVTGNIFLSPTCDYGLAWYFPLLPISAVLIPG
jgi:hypothetical protein